MCDGSGLTAIDRVYKKGNKGGKVKLIQEWLSLHGHALTLDGVFGSATDTAVREFQAEEDLEVDGEVGPLTFGALAKPMVDALAMIPSPPAVLGELVAAYARQHLAQGPREIGGQNRGPWVRLYMQGNEGSDWPWCAGFVSCMLSLAVRHPGHSRPIGHSFSSSQLANYAAAAERLVRGKSVADKARIRPGSFFLVPGTTTPYKHVGIVESVNGDVFKTIEGNTNDEGTAEGYEVCMRTRTYKNYDFIAI